MAIAATEGRIRGHGQGDPGPASDRSRAQKLPERARSFLDAHGEARADAFSVLTAHQRAICNYGVDREAGAIANV